MKCIPYRTMMLVRMHVRHPIEYLPSVQILLAMSLVNMVEKMPLVLGPCGSDF